MFYTGKSFFFFKRCSFCETCVIWKTGSEIRKFFLFRIFAFMPSSSIIAEFDEINASIYEFAVSLPSSVHSSLIQFPAIYKCKCDHFGHWRGYVCPSFSKSCHRGWPYYVINVIRAAFFPPGQTFRPATAQNRQFPLLAVHPLGC